jgi:gamma-glutamyltranspeptidase/glutathione hydrolase
MDRCVDGIAGRLAPYEAEVEKEVAALFDDDRLAEVVRHLGSHFPGSGARRGTHTTSLSAVDREGSLVCLTQTLDHGFGSGVVIPGTGVLMNNGMAWLNTDPSTDRADLVRPHRRTFVPVVPVLALSKADRPQVALGTPGGNGIPQTTLQVCANLLFRGDDLQTAIGRPRLTVGIIVPELGSAEDIQLEAGFAPEVYEALRKPEMDTGYRNFGRFHAVQRACDGRAVAVDDSRQ